MQNFIVWMNPDREDSEAAAARLNGAVLTAHTDGVMAAIGRELKKMNLEADLAVFAQACEEFAKQANADMVCISTSNGCLGSRFYHDCRLTIIENPHTICYLV